MDKQPVLDPGTGQILVKAKCALRWNATATICCLRRQTIPGRRPLGRPAEPTPWLAAGL
jgi:hypothetical protein